MLRADCRGDMSTMSEVKYQADRQSRDEIWIQSNSQFGSDELASNIVNAHILIVDDQRFMRDLIRMGLETAGYHNFSYASDGQEALDKAAETAPDLVILDLVMSGMDGYQFCRVFRTIDQFVDTPVLVQSSVEGGYSRAQVFAVGASDVVSKPIEIVEFLSRVCTHLERHYLVKKLRDYYRRMEHEVEAMQEMQMSLLPDVESLSNLTNAAGITIDASYQASDRLGGDLWGAHRLDDDRFGFYLVDFSGRGAASSVNTFRLQTFIDSGAFDWSNPAAALASANKYLSGILNTGTFATVFYGIIDTVAYQLKWSAAGCPPPILVRRDGSRKELESAGLPLGISAETVYACNNVPFGPGNRLFSYSDGLIECPKPDQPVLPPDRVAELVARSTLASASDVITCIAKELAEKHSEPIPDDVTMLAVDWLEVE